MPNLSELLALPAGRELDCAVHEAMGERIVWEDGIPYHDPDKFVEQLYQVPRYSAYIIYAWPLMAEMLEAGVGVFLTVFEDGLNLLLDSDYGKFIVPTLSDAPLAITRAWLTWKLQGDDDADAE